MKPIKEQAKNRSKAGRGGKSTGNKTPVDIASLEKTKEDLAEVLLSVAEGSDVDENSARFEKEFNKLRKKVSVDKGNSYSSDSANQDMLRIMLAMVLELIPVAEAAARKTLKEGNFYALNALVNQAREISNDLRLSKPLEDTAFFIKDRIMEPVFKQLASHMINEMMSIKNEVDTTDVSTKQARLIKKRVDKSMLIMSRYLTDMILKVEDDTHAYITGDIARFNPAKKRARP